MNRVSTTVQHTANPRPASEDDWLIRDKSIWYPKGDWLIRDKSRIYGY